MGKVKSYFEREKPQATVSHGNRIDLVINNGNTEQKVTVEVKPRWENYDFTFEVVHLSRRYASMINDGVWFCVVNYPLTRMALIKGEDIRDIPNDGLNYLVPLDKVTFIDLV